MKIFYPTFICIFFNVYITKAAELQPFTIDIYLPIFSCLDEFVAGNLFYPVKEEEKYGKIWDEKGYTENKKYPPLSTESGNLIVETRYGLSFCGGGYSWREVYLPIYVFKNGNFCIRFFFSATYAYPKSLVVYPLNSLKFVGNINVFCWLGNIKNIGDKNDENVPVTVPNENIVIRKESDLINVVLSKPVDMFYSPGERLDETPVGDDDIFDNDFDLEEKDMNDKKNKLEFDYNIFSFVFLGKDPFSEDYKGLYCWNNRKYLTVEQSDDDNINDKKNYFDYFNRKIKSLFNLNEIKNFLRNQKVFLGDKTSSAADDIKKLLDNAFELLKHYSEENWATKAAVASKVEVVKEKNCCVECCKKICEMYCKYFCRCFLL